MTAGFYLVNGTEIVEDNHDAEAILKQKMGDGVPSKAEAAKNTIAYNILQEHNTSGNMDKLKIKFDKLTSHDITFVGSFRQQERQDWRNSRSLMY